MKRFFKRAIVIVITMLTAFPITQHYASGVKGFTSTILTNEENDKIALSMDALENIFRFAERNFIYDINYNKVYEAMAAAMLDAFDDEWTMYIPSSSSDEYRDHRIGNYSGIGIYLIKLPLSKQNADDPKTLYITITNVFKDAPSYKAGLKRNDLITHINGESVISKTAGECAAALKGDKGSTVTLSIMRGKETFEVQLEREEVSVPTVQSVILQDNIAYIRIYEFTTQTAEQVSKELDLIKDSAKALIIDMRDNGGGDVPACIEVADFFLPSGSTIVSTEGKTKEMNRVYLSSTKEKKIDENIPIVLLINSGTASAAELLAGALKENGRAVVFGEKSYGKGVMQVSAPFEKGFANITAAEYKTPNGNTVNKVGILPDVEIKENHGTQEEQLALLKMLKENVFSEYADKHPTLSPFNVNRFADEYSEEYDISPVLLKKAITEEYVNRSNTDSISADLLKYDDVVNYAITYINKRN